MKSEKEQKYVALLRGINVGGKNIIQMGALRNCFEKMGFTRVTSYIQSGNVVFCTHTQDTGMTEKIEHTLSKQFKYTSKVVLVSHAQLKATVKKAPKGFGEQPDLYRYDVIFLKHPTLPKDAFKEVKAKPGVDTVLIGKHVLYFSRLISKAPQSHLTKIIGTPVYQQMTIRNWNTTTRLLEIVENLNESIEG